MSERIELNYLEMKGIVDLCDKEISKLIEGSKNQLVKSSDSQLEDWRVKHGLADKDVTMDGITVDVKEVKGGRVEFYESIKKKFIPAISEIEHISYTLDRKHDNNKNLMPVL